MFEYKIREIDNKTKELFDKIINDFVENVLEEIKRASMSGLVLFHKKIGLYFDTGLGKHAFTKFLLSD